MKVLDAISDVPGLVGRAPAKYAEVYAAVLSARGAWVPVQCEGPHEAHRLYTTVRHLTRAKERYEVKRRKYVVYIRLAQPVVAPLTLAK